jgi:hypothetical protein
LRPTWLIPNVAYEATATDVLSRAGADRDHIASRRNCGPGKKANGDISFTRSAEGELLNTNRDVAATRGVTG